MKTNKKEQPKKHTVEDAHKYFSESPQYKKYMEQVKPTVKPSNRTT